MFPYFGSKRRAAYRYPEPEYSTVIEPFAGSASYSLHHRPEKVIAVEYDRRVFELWQRLLELRETPPPPEIGTRTEDLFHMLLTYSEHALTSKYMTVTSRMVRDWNAIHRRILEESRYVRGAFTFLQGSYEDAPDIEATWFIDPPYQYANKRGYLHGASSINFDRLREFCLSRKGQVIVAEQEGADWLDFKPLFSQPSHRGSRSTEVVYIKERPIQDVFGVLFEG